MDTSLHPKRRHHFGTWFVIILGLLEIGAIAAFVELKGVAGTVCAASGIPQTVAPVGAATAGGAAAMPSADAGETGQAVTASPAAAPAAGSSAASPGTAAESDASVKGDTNQIVDPNCVGKTAASLLNSDTPAPGPTTTCGAMKQPEALKAAERQISH